MTEIRTVTSLPENMLTRTEPVYYELSNDKPLNVNNHDELRAMLNEGRLMKQKNPPVCEIVEEYKKRFVEITGYKEEEINFKASSVWPDTPSQSLQFPSGSTVRIKAKFGFGLKSLDVYTDDEIFFSLADAIVRVKFVGSKSGHTCYIPEDHEFEADMFIGYINDETSLRAFLTTGFMEASVYEVDEFIMFSAIKQSYCRDDKEPKAIDDNRVLIAYFNKAENRLHIVRTSFEHGSCEDDDAIISLDDSTR